MQTFGSIVGTIIAFGLLIGVPCAIAYDSGKAAGRKEMRREYVKDCEKSLPRDQYCVLQAVPAGE